MSDSLDKPARELPPEGSTDRDITTKISEPEIESFDISLIRELLKLTPTERLQAAQDRWNYLQQLRRSETDPRCGD